MIGLSAKGKSPACLVWAGLRGGSAPCAWAQGKAREGKVDKGSVDRASQRPKPLRTPPPANRKRKQTKLFVVWLPRRRRAYCKS